MIVTLILLLITGTPEGKPLSGEALEARTKEVSSLLRCPVCQGMSVADSPAEMAVNMKREVRELLARGYTEKQILAHFETSYGQFVLLEPKFEGVNALVWILPAAGLVIGAAILARQWKKLAAAGGRA
jgi:cytochrome c-type biogenesis protein CcmH